ncbi:hypothetical protein J3E73DRAFT_412057 [Bipolaris maydis]|nr:hypothetical protein J3E73DRAFT_412057 [Bipolaris maydis]
MNLEAKTVHPFFSKPPNGQIPDSSQPKNNASANNVHDPSKGRKEKTFVSHLKNQASLDRFTRPPPTQTIIRDIVDPNHDRRKRQKTKSPEPLLDSSALAKLESPSLDWHQQLQAQVDGPADLDSPPNTHVHTDVTMTGAPEVIEYDQKEHSNTSTTPSTPSLPAYPEPVAVPSESLLEEPKDVTPKKQIKITKSGRLVSSPPKSTVDPTSPPKKRRGRKPKHAKVLPTVTVIKYGTDPASRSAIGQKIEEILSAKRKSTKREASQKNAQPKPAAPSKVTHPFFLGKAQKDSPPVKVITELPAVTPRKSAVTPGKLRAETRRDESPEPTSFYNRGLHTSKAGKQSGLNEPSWPTSENVHVRNMEPTNLPARLDNSNSVQLALRPRKMKNAVVTLPEHEDMIARLAHDLSKDQSRTNKNRTTEFAPPQDVRLPTRLLTTGSNIKRRVHEQLLARSPSLATAGQPQSFHTAVVDLLREIEYNLTPFDQGKCEVQSWAQKYAPKSSAHVLQTGTDAVVLKDWLQSLTVMTVSGASKTTATVDVKQPPRKKRKKAFDDFIVPDDEEEEEEDMVMLPHVEGRSYMEPSSFRRPQWTRDKNVILISGPHGCGKSATVHAVAKEMGFEVFEIHAGMRRSGKDIQDKVGDMTGNHLVNHKRNAASIQEPSQTVENTEEDHVDALEKDISSGRQGTMTSFFQTKPKAIVPKIKAQPRPQEVKKVAPSPAQATLPLTQTSRKSQKQSLILIEEADILFDEDQQFWTQITKIASLSKRPIIITCNDERQIPMHDLPLAAVLRLQSPPVELAADYLLVLAGREGHVLARQAVKELYQSKGCDLRASIMELDFWCQISVGDRKGGLEWTYQRWPPGKDVDEHGQTLRVASEGTYQSGMGWLSHNVFEAPTNTAFDKEEELLQEVWTDWGMEASRTTARSLDGWGISPSDWGTPMTSNQQTLNVQNTEPSHRMQALDSLDAYTESLSAADIFCRVDLPSYSTSHTQPTDASQPPIPEKSRQNYTLAAPLLQIDHTTDFLHLSTSLTIQTHLLIHRAYPTISQTRTTPSPAPTSEPAYAKAILRHEQLKASNTSHTHAQTLPPHSTASPRPLTNSSQNAPRLPSPLHLSTETSSLEQMRARMSDVLGPATTSTGAAGLGPARKARTTRASRVALEGGVRESKRRDRWFEALGEFDGVMRTAGRAWAGMGWRGEAKDDVLSLVGSERDGEFEVDEDYVMSG